jgi:hypothetical protein
MGLNINTDKSAIFCTNWFTTEIKKSLANAEDFAKDWVEDAIDSLGGEITPKNPIHWHDGNYITKLVMEDGKVAAVIGHKRCHKRWLRTQSKYPVIKWVYDYVTTFKIENSGFKWTQLYESLTGDNVTGNF